MSESEVSKATKSVPYISKGLNASKTDLLGINDRQSQWVDEDFIVK